MLYIPGKDNIVADAMSRWAYPASKSFQDVSIHGSAASKVETERKIQLERERERCTASLVPSESNLACQALSFAVSDGGQITHLDKTLDGLPIPEGEEDDSHWVEVEPTAAQVKLQETRPDLGGPNSPPSLDTMPLLVQTNTVSTGATGSEHGRRPSATPIMARDWSAAYATDANTAAEWSAYLEGKANAAK